MNSFKRAKQIGKQTESITDLKTAGVVAADTQENNPRHNAEISVKKEENNSTELESEALNMVQPAIPEKNAVPPSMEAPIATTEKNSGTTAPPSEAEPPSYSIPKTKPKIISQPIIYEEASLQAADIQPQTISPVQTAPSVSQQPRYSEPTVTYVEPVEIKPVKNSRENVPNMFSKKSESKSTRKSLVLKPSSVKKAEAYCEKNGGSFNELIQILLDNFIDEYGL